MHCDNECVSLLNNKKYVLFDIAQQYNFDLLVCIIKFI